MAKHGKATRKARGVDRPREALLAGRGGHARSRAWRRPSSTRRSRCTSTSGSTSATPTSSSAARSSLPHGTGSDVRVAVFAQGDKAREAEEAGADIVGADDLATRIEGGFNDFDVAIATPDMMGTVGQPRPHPRPARPDAEPEDGHRHLRRRQGRRASRRPASSSTAPTAARTCTSRSARRASTSAALVENYAAVIEEIVRAKPAAAKGRYIHAITLASTMGPGIHVDPARTRGIVDELAESDGDAAQEAAQLRPNHGRTARDSRQPRGRRPAEVGLEDGSTFLEARPRAGLAVFERRANAESREGDGSSRSWSSGCVPSDTLIVADYRGLSMPEIDDVRTKLLETGARFSVVKNTLTRQRGRGRRRGGAARPARGPDGDRVPRAGERPGRGREGAERGRQRRRACSRSAAA